MKNNYITLIAVSILLGACGVLRENSVGLQKESEVVNKSKAIHYYREYTSIRIDNGSYVDAFRNLELAADFGSEKAMKAYLGESERAAVEGVEYSPVRAAIYVKKLLASGDRATVADTYYRLSAMEKYSSTYCKPKLEYCLVKSASLGHDQAIVRLTHLYEKKGDPVLQYLWSCVALENANHGTFFAEFLNTSIKETKLSPTQISKLNENCEEIKMTIAKNREKNLIENNIDINGHVSLDRVLDDFYQKKKP